MLRRDPVLFTIVVSEKGGAERRETFSSPEVTVGRVQGNELMLSKGNVSKRHAKVVFRDGRFIVSDLNSTNGTYVNRRKITQPTLVRDGDRIYVGDFVLKLELPESTNPASPAEVSGVAPMVEPAVSSSTASSPAAGAYPAVPLPPKVPVSRVETTASVESFPVAPADSAESVAPPGAVDAGSERLVQSTALARFVEQIVDMLPPGALDGEADATLRLRIEQLLEQAAAAGELGSGEVRDALLRAARAELLELGPLGALLEDREVTDIVVVRFDEILVGRGGSFRRVSGFSSDAALRRVVHRACRGAGAGAGVGPDTASIQCRLLGGAHLWALLGSSTSGGASLAIRKPDRAARTLDQLVRNGTVSRQMATLLGQLVAARANCLVVGPRDSGGTALVGALAAAAPGDPRYLFQDADDLGAADHVVRIDVGAAGELARDYLRRAATVRGARLTVDLSRPDLASELLEALGEGLDGVVAHLPASSLSRGLTRLVVHAAAENPGVEAALLRELVGGAFDVLIEVARLADGRVRVLRVAQVAAQGAEGFTLEDLFTFQVGRTAAGGAVEGTFFATGVQPRLSASRALRVTPG